MMLKRFWNLAATASMLAVAISPAWAAPAADEAAFREIYRDLVETNTTLSVGSCTLAAERMAARLKAAGFPASDLHIIIEPSHPREGNLVAIMPGTDAKAKALLLLAHIDVVEANRADWERDPFILVEEDGFFYARGSHDDKAQAAIWVDTLIRFKQSGFKPKRTVKMALTCGEETAGAFNGAEYLVKVHRQLIDAGFALNEGASAQLDDAGNRVAINIQAGEKFPQNYRLEATNIGGHSSVPVKDNAITHLAEGLAKVGAYDFPVEHNAVTLNYFKALAPLTPGPVGTAMASFAANPADAEAANKIAGADRRWNSMLRTTCVATMLDGGHATNALPQRARANVNCRIFPGTSVETIRAALESVVADPNVKVMTLETRGPNGPPPELTADVMGAVKAAANAIFPGVPVVPTMATGATDAAFLTPAGIPTYGFQGFFVRPEGSNAHGLNERILVKSLMDGRQVLYRLVKDIASR